MKILCCNPIFFEYRIPFYKELNRVFHGEFYVLISPKRFRIRGKEKLIEQTRLALGENAILHDSDAVFDVVTKRLNAPYDPEHCRLLSVIWGLGKVMRRLKPDAIFTVGYFQWTPFILLAAMVRGIPVYMGYERTLHTERRSTWLQKCQRRFFNRFFKGFLVNGSETRRYLQSLGVADEKIHIAGMCADSDYMAASARAFRSHADFEDFRKFVLGTDSPTGLCFLFTGKLDERKGVTHLLQAWRQHIRRYPDDHLVMVGEGRQSAECRDLAADMPSVHIQGWCDYESIPKYYAIADVALMPTIEDNWSLAVPEAMSCGLPVATSIYNGCHPELIHEGRNGYTFDTFKHETIVDALHRFHESDLKSMGKISAEIEKEYNCANTAQRVYEAMRKDLDYGNAHPLSDDENLQPIYHHRDGE